MASEQAAESYTVEELVAVNPYNPDILNDLEGFVNDQVNPSHGILAAPFDFVRVIVGILRRIGPWLCCKSLAPSHVYMVRKSLNSPMKKKILIHMRYGDS